MNNEGEYRCVNCSFEGNVTFFVEKYPCKCGEEVHVFYNMCPACGAFWRTCNDVVLDEVDIVSSTELRDLMLAAEMIEDADTTMEDSIVRCISCNAPAYRAGENLYSCTKCTTEWEVILVD